MKYLFYFLEIIFLFASFVMMVIGMISDSTAWYVQLIIAFIGAPAWIWMVSNIGEFNRIYVKD